MLFDLPFDRAPDAPSLSISQIGLLCVVLAGCASGSAEIASKTGGLAVGEDTGGSDGAADGSDAGGDGGATDGGATDGGATDGGEGGTGGDGGGTGGTGGGTGGTDGGTGDGGGADGTEPPPPPASCAEVLAADPGAASGRFEIDLDGPGGLPPFTVACDMETDGGGWTRFWWAEADALRSSEWAAEDVLGADLVDCGVSDRACFARIPVSAPGELLVVGEDYWGAWDFDARNSTSRSALSAFVDGDGTDYRLDRYGDAWNPRAQSRSDGDFPSSYACDAEDTFEGDGRGCANFWYDEIEGASGFNLDDDGGYAQTAFAAGSDNVGSFGVDSFEVDEDRANNHRDAPLTLYWR